MTVPSETYLNAPLWDLLRKGRGRRAAFEDAVHGHVAQDVGRRFTDKTGRPSRIIEIQFESKKHDKNKK